MGLSPPVTSAAVHSDGSAVVDSLEKHPLRRLRTCVIK